MIWGDEIGVRVQSGSIGRRLMYGTGGVYEKAGGDPFYSFGYFSILALFCTLEYTCFAIWSLYICPSFMLYGLIVDCLVGDFCVGLIPITCHGARKSQRLHLGRIRK